ncbi:Rrf2 family transcriptional regulator [Lutimonas saemankumensis]|uniref:RrF2 family transcriptional regulator n=1 Tax=Lutimonas saemankumensis TaxID=483016 RepID=UPI001CD6DE91|nr:Rrf2 family transcriptional regulator [Lutimonas saemankumensis]MCA0933430.1 Rrf2 family transcriptional regulator [Lutimonas saemankumensis]
MLSNQSQYAIRGVVFLAINASEKRKYGSKEIGEHINVPVPFLAKIFQNLSKEGLITSSKGPKGGFYLKKNQLKGNLMSIIECIDGPDNFNSCLIGLPQCSDSNPCTIHNLAAPLRNEMLNGLRNRSIADFANDTKKGKSHIF